MVRPEVLEAVRTGRAMDGTAAGEEGDEPEEKRWGREAKYSSSRSKKASYDISQGLVHTQCGLRGPACQAQGGRVAVDWRRLVSEGQSLDEW